MVSDGLIIGMTRPSEKGGRTIQLAAMFWRKAIRADAIIVYFVVVLASSACFMIICSDGVMLSEAVWIGVVVFIHAFERCIRSVWACWLWARCTNCCCAWPRSLSVIKPTRWRSGVADEQDALSSDVGACWP
jgi:hypothetical protein